MINSDSLSLVLTYCWSCVRLSPASSGLSPCEMTSGPSHLQSLPTSWKSTWRVHSYGGSIMCSVSDAENKTAKLKTESHNFHNVLGFSVSWKVFCSPKNVCRSEGDGFCPEGGARGEEWQLKDFPWLCQGNLNLVGIFFFSGGMEMIWRLCFPLA